MLIEQTSEAIFLSEHKRKARVQGVKALPSSLCATRVGKGSQKQTVDTRVASLSDEIGRALSAAPDCSRINSSPTPWAPPPSMTAPLEPQIDPPCPRIPSSRNNFYNRQKFLSRTIMAKKKWRANYQEFRTVIRVVRCHQRPHNSNQNPKSQ